MAASVRVEGFALVDPRVELLGELAGYNRFEALGRLTHLWAQCTDRQLKVVPHVLVRAVLGLNGVEALIGSDLGEPVEGGIRIKGTDGRIEWLGDRRAAATEGGKKRAAAARSGGRFTSQAPAKRQPRTSQPPATDQPNASPLSLSLSLSKSRSRSRSEELPPEAAAPPPEPDEFAEGTKAGEQFGATSAHAAFIARFTELYAEANGGAKPTWGGKQGGWVRDLLKAHGLEECVRRATNMLRAPPDWPKGPHDLAALVRHFDLFAKPHRPTGGHFKVTGEETYAGGEVKL